MTTDGMETAANLIGTGIGLGALAIGAGVLFKTMGKITEVSEPKRKSKKKIMKRKVKFMGLN